MTHPTLDHIAQTILGLETLDTRNSDRLDFHDLAVWNIKAALQAAFEAGQQETSPNPAETSCYAGRMKHSYRHDHPPAKRTEP